MNALISWTEIIGAIAVITWLAWRVFRPERGRMIWPILVAVVLGLTVCQPIGVVGTPVHLQRFQAAQDDPADTQGWHELHYGPFPVWFHLDHKSLGGLNWFGNSPSTGLGARSYLGSLTNEASVGVMGEKRGSEADWSTIALYHTTDGHYEFSAGTPQEPIGPSWVQLHTGIASTFGLVYWITATSLIALGLILRWLVRRDVNPAEAPSAKVAGS